MTWSGAPCYFYPDNPTRKWNIIFVWIIFLCATKNASGEHVYVIGEGFIREGMIQRGKRGTEKKSVPLVLTNIKAQRMIQRGEKNEKGNMWKRKEKRTQKRMKRKKQDVEKNEAEKTGRRKE